MSTKFPLRAKRKAETRLKLIRTARELFLNNGYEETTLEEIADKAGLHVQTLYRHFATKQDLANAGDKYWLDLFEKAITAEDREGDTFTFWRNWMAQAIDVLTQDGGQGYRTHIRMRNASPPVLGAIWAIHAAYEDLLTESLAKDFGMAPEGISTPRLVAGMLMSGNSHVLRSFDRNSDFDLKTETLKVIDTVRDMFKDLIKASAA